MSTEHNKALVQRFIDQVMNSGRFAAIAELCVPGSRFAGGMEGQTRAIRTAFPDFHMSIDEVWAKATRSLSV